MKIDFEMDIEKLVKEGIDKQLDTFYSNELTLSRGYDWHNGMRGYITSEIENRIIERFVDEKYLEIVSKIDTDKIVKIIEGRAAINIIKDKVQ